jgi:subtilisin-like proprotein convertase family protein
MLSLNTPALHSNLGAPMTILLDFDGHNIRNTVWNVNNFGNIVNLPYDTDGDLASFSQDELDTIQSVWERVSEDFLPFNIDVTTEDPGVEALKNTGGTDTQWGQRIVIGGASSDWYLTVNPPDPASMAPPPPYVAKSASFYSPAVTANDTPAFIFSTDVAALATAEPVPVDKALGEVVSHVVGTTLGLQEMGQRVLVDPGPPPKFSTVAYPGHGTGATGWSSIMGTSFKNALAGAGVKQELTQWAQGEYQFADPIQDELGAITNTGLTGVDYRPDDHGNTRALSDPLAVDSSASTTDSIVIADSGIVEQSTDIDYFSFTVDGLGAILNLDVSPFTNGPNLDILAKVYNSSGTVKFTSNPISELLAGGQTLSSSPDGGWLDATSGDYTDTIFLQPGTYYVSVEGTGKPTDLTNPMAPDWGYTKYGSLGYYSITGSLKKGLVVGVDFDVPGGTAPENWNLYTGGGPTGSLTDLISESGAIVPYRLNISTTGTSIDTFESSNGIVPADLPAHAVPLDELGGYIGAEDETTTFTWSNLEPWSYHTVYVFGHADFDAVNHVTITGGNLNGTPQTISFDQTVDADGLLVNSGPASNADLKTFAYTVLSDGSGQIIISVTSDTGEESAIAGLAIAPTRPIGPAQNGSISGQKWNDINGNKIKDGSEPGLAGFTIYIDANNNGVLDSITTPDQPNQTLTVASTDIPQAIPDQNIVGVKSSLNFTGMGTIQDINVSLDITHTYDADVHVTLISPSGTRVLLFQNIGFNGDNFHNTILDDSAILPISNQAAPFTGTFRPEVPLSTFNNEDAFGEWKLELIDDAHGDLGTLNSWSITIQLKGSAGTSQFLEPFQVTDTNGNYSFDNLPPGLYNIREYISPAQVAAGWQQTWAPAPITVTSGDDVTGHDFGNWIPTVQRGSIQGQKYYDSNQNGVKDGVDVGLPGWIAYIDLNNNGVRDIASTPTVVRSTDAPKAIQDLKTTQSQVTVGSLGTIFNVEVTLDITHSFVGDLNVYLVSPTGRQVELFTGVGGQYNDFHNLTLSDNAARSIDTIGFNDLPYTGTWRPEGALSDFSGDDSAGIWTLVVSDTAASDEGVLNSWSLSFTSGELFRTTDENGNYQFDNLLAGNYIVREEPQAGWVQIPPTDTAIPGAIWNGTQWTVTVAASDDPNDPDGPDSHRNVKNVDFGNYAASGSISGYVYRDLDANGTRAATEAGLPGWTVFLDANNNGVLDTGTVDGTVTSDTAQAINNFVVVSSQLYFDSMATISDVNLSLDISHTYDADLSVYLISPSGTRVKLFSGIGGSGDNFTGTSFDDSALQSITDASATPPFTDVFKPAEPLSIFNGENAIGYWTLEIKDNATGDDGSLNGWSLSIKGDELSTVTDAQGHYSFLNLPPNTYHVDTVQIPDWTRTEAAAAVTLLPSQNFLTANFGERPPYLPGDFNSDGLVDAADFLVWRRQSGTNVPNYSGADGDGDGDVDQDDLALWRQNFGHYYDDHGNNAATATAAVLTAPISGKIELPIDVDWFSFTAKAGTQYRIKTTLGTLDAGNLQLFGTDGTTPLASNSDATPLIEWTAPVDGTYYAQVKGLNASSVGTYSLELSAIVFDDYGNDAASSAPISVPALVGGEIEIANDVDWFNFTATAGDTYNISVQLDTLPYATLRVIGTDGTTSLLSSGGFGPSVQWTAPSSGTYYLEAGGLTNTGTYFVSIAVDDHGDTSGTATAIAIPSTTAGSIEAPYDLDVFSFVATSGTSYRFRTTLNSLNDSTLSLLAPDGTTQLSYDDDGGGGLSSLIDWIAPSSGTYFVEVAGFGSDSGSYDLVASINGPGSGSSALLAPAASGLMMESDSASLLSSEQPVSSTEGPSLLGSFVVVSQGTAGGSAQGGIKPVSQSRSESGTKNDLALLAWLANSSGGNHSSAGQSLADDDSSASYLSNEPESVDVAFELLEGNALAATTI